MLLGPCSPCPDRIDEFPAPLLVLWAKDDQISSFDDRIEWNESLGNSQVARISLYPSGGHNFHDVLKNPGCADAVRNFFTACFLLMQLLHDMTDKQCNLDYEAESDTEVRFRRLYNDLP